VPLPKERDHHGEGADDHQRARAKGPVEADDECVSGRTAHEQGRHPLFCDFAATRDALAEALGARPSGEDALTTLRDFIVSSAHAKNKLQQKLELIIESEPTLSSHKRARLAQVQELLAVAIADDLGAGPEDDRPQVAAASLTAAFEVLERKGRGLPPPQNADEVGAAIDPVVSLVRAGLQSLTASDG
jgi:hypothetical protein